MKDLVGPYRIRSVLGHGGMGVVYLGIHDHLGREVAIKALAPELTQHPQFRERFFAEARVQAKLQHTNIVTIYDLIEDAGSYFIVMEYVPGPTLETLLEGGDGKGWDVDPALTLFRQILAGLDYAHSKGVIHRD
ncbi:MAG TPA: serine/threonine-protein kinase, partial [Thermoanaerobaculia bacterium]